MALGDVNDIMPGSDFGWFLVIFEKKRWVEIPTWAKGVDFRASARPGQLGLRDVLHVVGSDGTVSIVEIVSLSLLVSKNLKVKKVISFVPEPRDSWVFRDSYACKRFTYPYILCIGIFYVFAFWICYTFTNQMYLMCLCVKRVKL